METKNCEFCSGKGKVEWFTEYRVCPICEGLGVVEVDGVGFESSMPKKPVIQKPVIEPSMCPGENYKSS